MSLANFKAASELFLLENGAELVSALIDSWTTRKVRKFKTFIRRILKKYIRENYGRTPMLGVEYYSTQAANIMHFLYLKDGWADDAYVHINGRKIVICLIRNVESSCAFVSDWTVKIGEVIFNINR